MYGGIGGMWGGRDKMCLLVIMKDGAMDGCMYGLGLRDICVHEKLK